MPGVMMQLGDFQFTVDTAPYQEFTRIAEYRWPIQERILHRPTAQWVGIGKDTWDFDGTVYGAFNRAGTYAGTYQISRLRALAEQGVELRLVDGRGNDYGEWCIVTVRETASDFVDHGGPRKQKFALTIVRQGESTFEPAAGEAGAGGEIGIPAPGGGTFAF